jgi:hypothetical protein
VNTTTTSAQIAPDSPDFTDITVSLRLVSHSEGLGVVAAAAHPSGVVASSDPRPSEAVARQEALERLLSLLGPRS